jgi:hypothetical protein
MINTLEYENDKDYLEALELLDEEYSSGRVTPYTFMIRTNIEYGLPIKGGFRKAMDNIPRHSKLFNYFIKE